MKLGYIQINDWTPPKNQERFVYGHLEGSLYPEYETGIDDLDKEDEWIIKNQLCINTDLYDMSSQYWIVGPWNFFEKNFPELLPDLHEEPYDSIYKGDCKCFPIWSIENFGLEAINSDEVIFGKFKYIDVTKYVLVFRSYSVDSGWSSWSKPENSSEYHQYDTREKAEVALKKELRESTDTFDWKIVEKHLKRDIIMRHNRSYKDDLKREIDVATAQFEELCGNCDNFGDSKNCPFFERAQKDTFWRSELRCTKYDD